MPSNKLKNATPQEIIEQLSLLSATLDFDSFDTQLIIKAAAMIKELSQKNSVLKLKLDIYNELLKNK